MSYQAKQYAEALEPTISSIDELNVAVASLRAIKHMIETDRSTRLFFDNPNISINNKQQVITAALTKSGANQETANTAALMLANDDLYKLSKTIYALKKFVLTKLDATEAYVTSATPLSDDSRATITKAVQHTEHSDNVLLHEHVDPTLLGGFIVQIQDQVRDLSVRGKLSQLRSS